MQDITARQVTRVAACVRTAYTDCEHRLWREREIDDREADEDYPSEWLLTGRAGDVPTYHFQERHRLRESIDSGHATVRD